MTQAQKSSPTAERVLQAALSRDLPALEDLWIDLIGDPPSDLEYYRTLFEPLGKIGPKERVKELVNLLVEQIEERAAWALLYGILKLGAPIWPDCQGLVRVAPRCLRSHFSELSQVDELISSSRLTDGAPLDEGLKRFRSLLRLVPGQVFQHKAWGEGIVRELDLRAAKIILDFPGEKNKSVTFSGVKNFLLWLQPDHFLARRAREPESLWEQGETRPAELIRLAVESAGGRLKQADLKTLLIEAVVPKDKWNSWWGKARSALRADPMIDFDSKGGAHAEILLRDKPKTPEEEIHDTFLSEEADLTTRIEAFARLIELKKSLDVKPKLPRQMIRRLNEMDQLDPNRAVADRLQMAYLVEDIKSAFPMLADEESTLPPPAALIGQIHDYLDLNGVGHVPYAMRALRTLLERDGDQGPDRAAAALPSASAGLAQAIWRELDEERHLDLAVKALEELFDRALDNPDTYLWAIRAVADGGWNHLEDYFPMTWLAAHLLGEMEVWQDILDEPRSPKAVASAARHLLSRARSLIQARNFTVLCKAVEQLPMDQARRLYKTVQVHKALNEALRAGALKQMRLTKRELEETPAAAPEEEKFHYCTARMKAARLAELNELNAVLIPANSREIEEARQEGDLRENAGYHAAKDKQKMLMQRSLQLQQALATARVVEPTAVRTEAVGFGTRVAAENLTTGQRETFTLLGRWEADPDRHLYSYQAPMMQQLLGRKPGEEARVEHPGGGHTAYRILTIENALASGQWNETGSSSAGATSQHAQDRPSSDREQEG